MINYVSSIITFYNFNKNFDGVQSTSCTRTTFAFST